MKQRFSSLDVRVIAHELNERLVSLRVSNIYDLSSKILLVKLAKQENKKQLVIDSGFRCHLTDFARTTAASPSQFVAKLRKSLKTRRVTSVAQIGTDRIIEFRFSDGQYRLYLEFFASGNVILTDGDLKILALLRNVSEGEGQEPQRVGLIYNLENRQNYGGVPPLTKERVRAALAGSVARAANAEAGAVKKKSKPGDELRKALATTITEIPPMLIEHAFGVTGFDSTTKPAEILAKESLLDDLVTAISTARKIIDDISSTETNIGYIIAKPMPGTENQAPQGDTQDDAKRRTLLYDDFHPFLPSKFANNSSVTVLKFEGFNKTVDEFFSSLEGQKLESRLNERESAAKKKLDAARQDQAKRIEGLQAVQTLNMRKAAAIEANVERVQEAMDAINGLLGQGMDWYHVGKLVEREQKHGNPVAAVIVLPLKIEENTITLLLGEEDVGNPDDDDNLADETDSDSDSDRVASEAGRLKAADARLAVDVNLGLSPWSNAREYYGERRSAVEKEAKTAAQSKMALRNAEQKIAADLRKGLKQEKAVLQPLRAPQWFEKFLWFVSSDGYLVLGGCDTQQDELLYARHLRRGDVLCRADAEGAAAVVVKNRVRGAAAAAGGAPPVPPSTLAQAGALAVCTSVAWDSKALTAAWWAGAEQVSKASAHGDLLPVGEFSVRGDKNYLPPAQLLVGLAVMFKISDASKARHLKHRLVDSGEEITLPEKDEEAHVPPGASGAAKAEAESTKEEAHSALEEDASDDENAGDEDTHPPVNPLQSAARGAGDDDDQSIPEEEAANVASLSITDDTHLDVPSLASSKDEDEARDASDPDTNPEAEPSTTGRGQSSAPSTSGAAAKKAQPKRGQRAKAKKLAKYKDQDEDDRLAAEALLGAAAGRQKAEAEARARAQREAEAAAALERRQAQQERRLKETVAHEARRAALLASPGPGAEGGAEEEGAEPAADLDALVGTPLPGDEILEAVVVCAPWAALGRVKYKAKLQPGATKKGRAVREVLERWTAEAARRGAVDELAQDVERMWPREVELLKALRAEEVVNCVPVGKVRVAMGGGGDGKGGQGKGARGGKGGGKKK